MHIRQIVPSQCLAQPMAMLSRCSIRSWYIEQAVFIMGQTSICCMICLMSPSHVSASFENPHFNMFTLDPANLLSVFPVHVVHGFSEPAGRCSSALMLRCTLASSGSSRSLHNSMRASFVIVLMVSVILIKLFRDFRRCTTPRCPLNGCLLVRSLPCPLRTTYHRSPNVWWRDSGDTGRVLHGVCWLQTACAAE